MYLEGEERGGEEKWVRKGDLFDHKKKSKPSTNNIYVEWVLLKSGLIVREESLIQALHDAPVDR